MIEGIQRGAVRGRATAANSKNNAQQIKTLSDLVKSLVKRQTAPKTKASRLWSKLREHVHRGFFDSVLNQAEMEPGSFLDNIEALWTLVHKHSSETSLRSSGGNAADSTTEFVMAGWAKIKEAQFAVNRAKAKGEGTDESKSRRDDGSHENLMKTEMVKRRPSYFRPLADDDDLSKSQAATEAITFSDPNSKPSSAKDRQGSPVEGPQIQHAQLRGGFGIGGLSFDTVPNVNVTSQLRIIAEGLYSQPYIEADFYTVQVNFNRGWKLLLLGLTQAEALGRYMAMCALRIAIPVINDTLLDYSTRQNLLLVLVNLMISDERHENRLKAVYLIGHIANELGTIREHDNLLLTVFKELMKRLLEIQAREKKLTGDDLTKYRADKRSMKIYLIHAIGKFLSNLSQNSRYMEDLLIYSLQSEFERGDCKLDLKSDGGLKKGASTGPLFVVKSLLGALVHDVKQTDQNAKYIGAIFKQYVSPLLKVATQGLQVVAVQFVSNWLPVTNEDNGILALDALESGLKLTKGLGIDQFDKDQYNKEMSTLKKKLIAEECRIALRSKLLRQLLLVPGTFSRLNPVPEHPGFFADNDSGLFNTKAIAVGLPIHPKSNVLISRPIPSIPGVPSAVTTIPPVFMEPTWYEKIPPPSCYYESMERTGGIPGLPVGYTCSPSRFIDVYAIKGIDRQKKSHEQERIQSVRQESVQPLNAKGKNNTSKLSLIPSATKKPSEIPVVLDDDEDDVLADMDDGYTPPAGFGFVKRRGTMIRIDIEHAGDNSDLLPIPTGTTKLVPLMKEEGVRFESLQRGDGIVREGRGQQSVIKKVPPGFLSVSPFPGYDPDSIDRNAQSQSAIYYRSDSNYQDPDFEKNNKIPSGHTIDKNPVLWPHKNSNLKRATNLVDFPLNAPVLFEIIQPGNPTLQQILCQVVGIDRDISAVSVQRETDADLLSPGATFNLFIRQRSNLTKWSCINLQVVDDNYRDNLQFSRHRVSMQSLSSMPSQAEPPRNAPIPSGFTSLGEPYFAPPVNVPPIPVGYTSDMLPYFAKVATVKPQPLGVTTDGIRFYNTDGSINEPNRNLMGGYDNSGQPFYIPKGCSLPTPIGFTSDGIAYFDIPSILNQKGVMILPVQLKDRGNWPTFEEDDDSITQLEVTPDGRTVPKRVTSEMLLQDLLTALKITQSEIKKTLISHRSNKAGAIRRLKDFKEKDVIIADLEDEASFKDPEDIMAYLREGDDLAHLKSGTMRVALEPASLDFQSVYAPVSKHAVLRYRANRGDREERDFFISVEPADIFTVPMFHLRLQGEGVAQISVTFNPILVRSERIEGFLSLIDETGRKLVSCNLVGLRQSFIKISPSSIDAGWMLPDKRKEISLKIENMSTVPIALTLELTSEANARTALATAAAMLKKEGAETSNVNRDTMEEIEKRGFTIPIRSVKLQPSESKAIPVFFEPVNLGRFSDGIEITAPGGDLIKVSLDGVAGIPIALYPETAENSQAGGHALTLERAEFMKKFRKNHSNQKEHTALTDIDISILQNMMSATSSNLNRRIAHTIDFGVCNPAPGATIMRCVTVMNLSDNSISLGLFPHLSALKCKYIVKVPPRSATTVEIELDLKESPKGNINTAIEVICPEFQNIPLYINAFVGQPLYFNTWDIAFFKPCPVGVTEHLLIPLINESQYEIEFSLTGLDSNEQSVEGLSYFTCMFSDNPEEMSKIPPFTSYNVNFGFTARQRGPWMKNLGFKLSKLLNSIDLPGCPSGNFLSLVGICIEPWHHSPGDTPDKNGLDVLRMWMSHPKRVLDEYNQNDSERALRFQQVYFDGSYRPPNKTENLEIVFLKDEVVFRQKPKNSQDPMAARRSQVQTLPSMNKGLGETPVVWLSSTLFMLEPRSKTMTPGNQEILDVMFVPPSENVDNVPIYGFAAALSDNDHKCHAISLMSKPQSDFLLFPASDKEGNVVLDFGRLETSTNSFDVNTKWVLLVNLYPQSYSWSIKFSSSRSKFNPFDATMTFGELEPNDCLAMPFSYRCDTSGAFESVFELTIKNTMDRLAKPFKLANIVLRTQSVTTSLTGFPDILDFGSTVVFHKKQKSFTLTNNGTTDTKVSLFCRGAFSISPRSFLLAPKSSQEVTITFAPTESRTSTTKLHIFANQKLYMTSISGTGGTAELICELYGSKDIDFGLQKEGTVAWVSLYLTNKGTLPLSLSAVTATRPDLIKLEYCNITSTVPYSSNQGAGNQFAVRKNFWGILQRKFAIFMILKGLTQNSRLTGNVPSVERRKATFIDENGIPVPIQRSDTISETAILKYIPELRPFFSYHFKLGYLNKYQPKKETDIHFRYMPITSAQENEISIALVKEMTLKATGRVFRSLEFFPTSYDFGITPVEHYSFVDSWKFAKAKVDVENSEESKSSGIDVINMSLEAQNVTLDFISPEFRISGKTWSVNPGDKIFIPIEFHPPKEQTQYRGEARFVHNNEKQVIVLTGTGASADVSADDSIDFGRLKIGSVSFHKLRICNRGLLESRFALDIVQKGTDFRFVDEEPYEYHGIILSGAAQMIDIECCCESVVSSKAHVVLKWEKVLSVWEEIAIPLLVQTGLPVFRLHSIELDFKTTYINVNKTLEFAVTNDGNASCYWALESVTHLLKVTPQTGTILPGDTIYVEVTFEPENFEPLAAEMSFFTDAGKKVLMCYGLVGVPYLMIPPEQLNLNFGICAIDKPQVKEIMLTNTGSKPIQFEIAITNMLENGVSAGSEFEVFFVQPANGTVMPNSSQPVRIQTIPKNYGSTVSANFVISSKDGERYIGSASVTGGRAIIKIAPPTFAGADTTESPHTAEVSDDAGAGKGTSRPRASLFEMRRLAFQQHIENLQDILSGLRTEQIEPVDPSSLILKSQSHSKQATPKQSKPSIASRTSLSTRDRTPTQPESSAMPSMSPRKKRDLQMLQKAEALIQERLGSEEYKRQSASGTVFDGSDLRAKVNRAIELANTRGFKKANMRDRIRPKTEPGPEDRKEDSGLVEKPGDQKLTAVPKAMREAILMHEKSEKYVQELASLESDLEILSAVVKSVSGSSESLISTPSSGSGLSRYNPGSSQRSRQGHGAPFTPGSRGQQSPTKRDTGSRGTRFATVPNTPFSRQVIANSGTLNIGDSGVQTDSGLSANVNAETIDSRTARKYNDLTAKKKERREIDEPGAPNTFEDFDEQQSTTRPESTFQPGSTLQSPLDDLVQLSHYYNNLIRNEEDTAVRKQLVEEINMQLIASTKSVIKLVKGQLSNQWIGNREFLSSALKSVQLSHNVLEALSNAKPSQNGPAITDFNLGLIRAGDAITDIRLFNLPNMGNLSLEFKINRNDIKIRPNGFPDEEEPDLFVFDPIEGVIEPGAAVNFSVNFLARAPGFYQQGYELESGGEKVLFFNITSMAGIPLIQVEPHLVDFGLVTKNKFDIRSIVVSNTGSFKDRWRLEDLNRDEFMEKVFGANEIEGVLEPKASITIDIKFAPKIEGNYLNSYRLHWTGEPRLVEVKGIGGGAKLKYTFVDLDDIRMKLLEWGTTVVGLSYSKEFIISNVGNVEGYFHMTHPNPLFRFDLPLDVNGEYRLEPGNSVKFKINFSPICSEKVDEPFQIHLIDSPVAIVPSKLIAGTKIWAIDGNVDFRNMSIKDTQTMTITILNAGTLPISLEYSLMLEDSQMEQHFAVTVLDSKPDAYGRIMIPASVEKELKIKITPKREHRKIVGKIILTTELGPGPEKREFAFDFWTYDKQLSLDDSKDVSVGRVLVGETATVDRFLTNFGSEKVKYRLRLDPVQDTPSRQNSTMEEDVPPLLGGKKKAVKAKRKGSQLSLKKIAWKIVGDAEGFLDANQTIPISANFESLEEHGDDWQEAMLIVSKCDDDSSVTWSDLSSMKLTGAAGTPKLTLSTDIVDFGVTGKDISNTRIVTLRNEGNALLTYEFETGWNYVGNIYFENIDLIAGKIPAGEAVDIAITFKPDLVMRYETELQIKSQLDKKTVTLIGQGALYKFLKGPLPPVISLGHVHIGTPLTENIKIYNDCIYDITVQAKLYDNDPADASEASETKEFISVDPKVIELLANGTDSPTQLDDRGFGEFSLIVNATFPTDEANVDELLALCNKIGRRNFIKLETLGGDKETGIHCIPVTYRFGVYDMALVSVSKYASIKKGDAQLEDSDRLKEIDFGEMAYEAGGSMVMVLYNRNPFKLHVETIMAGHKFAVYPPKASISPNSGKEFRVEMKPFSVSDGEEVSASITLHEYLKLKCQVPLIEEAQIHLTGTFIDEPETLEFNEVIDFGSIRRLFSGEYILEFRNPVRRSLKYKFSIEPDYRDIFSIEKSEHTISGIAKPRAYVTIPITFTPKLGTEYAATASLETDDRSFIINMKGVGVEPAIELSETKINFGIVGVGAAEYRDIIVSNTSKIDVKLGVKVTGAGFSLVNSDGDVLTCEFTLLAQAKENVRIVCNPAEVSSQLKGKVELVNLDIAPNQRTPLLLGSTALESIGGSFGFKIASPTDDEENEDDSEPTYDADGKLIPKVPTIYVNFTKIIMGQRVRKYFEVENCGDTMVDLVITDVSGREARNEVDFVSERSSFSFNPVAVVIKPHTKQKFAVIAKGLKMGQDTYVVHVRTRTHLEARIIPIRIKTNILSPESQLADGLKVFSRVDNSIEGLLVVKGPTEESLNSDLQLWKIYIPVIRVNLHRPSHDLQYIPTVEPNTVLPDIAPFVIRPPALPKDVPQKVRKWYSNRASMSLEQAAKSRATPGTQALDVRKQQALEFVRPVEKQVYVERTGAARRRMGGF